MTKTFAPNCERNKEGWIIFPRDSNLRALLFPLTDPSEHVAKANMHMVSALVEFVSEIGENILDPFAGTGTILVGATLGRDVYMIELEEHFQHVIEQNIKGLKKAIPDIDEVATLIQGDCSRILPIPDFFNHMIFSPPYSNLLRKSEAIKNDKTSVDLGYGSAALYTAHPDNVGNLNDFLYAQKMEKTYKKFYSSLKPGGTMTIIIKDRMVAGKRVALSDRAARDCIRLGFEFVDRNKWYAKGGGYAATNRSHGLETVDDEDLITLRRPL